MLSWKNFSSPSCFWTFKNQGVRCNKLMMQFDSLTPKPSEELGEGWKRSGRKMFPASGLVPAAKPMVFTSLGRANTETMESKNPSDLSVVKLQRTQAWWAAWARLWWSSLRGVKVWVDADVGQILCGRLRVHGAGHGECSSMKCNYCFQTQI